MEACDQLHTLGESSVSTGQELVWPQSMSERSGAEKNLFLLPEMDSQTVE
jgi:hypothetical protein